MPWCDPMDGDLVRPCCIEALQSRRDLPMQEPPLPLAETPIEIFLNQNVAEPVAGGPERAYLHLSLFTD